MGAKQSTNQSSTSPSRVLQSNGSSSGHHNHNAMASTSVASSGRSSSTRVNVQSSGIKCPVCSKFVLPDDVECHLVMCLTKPRINYNEDMLTEDKREEILSQGFHVFVYITEVVSMPGLK